MHLPSLPARPAPEPNVTPLLDVLLVLIVAFLVIAAEGQRVLLAQLPQPGAGSGATTLLEVAAGARYRLNGEPVASTELATRLRGAGAATIAIAPRAP
ncbi:MAG TPA: biopolymer transporter ExbD [Gemmatimonadaceae bacterium]|nr:biopolymer transporter ExbD [Gemmatimonadaceae bacterium]